MSEYARSSKGFTILEVLIAISLFSVGMLALSSLAVSITQGTEFAKRKTQAVNIAVEKLEILKLIPYSDLEASGTNGNVSRTCTGAVPTFTCTPTGSDGTPSDPEPEMDGMTYSWTWKVTYKDLNADGDVGSGGIGDAQDIKLIEVIVTWTGVYGSHSQSISSLKRI